jgi:S-adenosylmethionine synthetase
VLEFLRPDGKSQVSVEYVGNTPKRIEAVVISTQHSPDISTEDLRREVRKISSTKSARRTWSIRRPNITSIPPAGS